ncbi:MAG: FG-GAP-like repeat-containing protein [Gemmataceae bacterium]|nr:FG-GAP-like repeat-containing protein [Gemmataceae bacterium]
MPSVECYEARILPATWVPLGPAPQFGSNATATTGQFGSPNQTYTGRVSAFAISPNYDGEGHAAMFVGAAGGGIWRSTNFSSGSPDWQPLTDFIGLPVDPVRGVGVGALNVGAIAVDPSNPQIIYVGTGEANGAPPSDFGTGILKSVNGGRTWTLISAGPTFAFVKHSISKIIVDPTDDSGRSAPGQTLYVSVVPTTLSQPTDSDDGIYKSANGGVDWVKVSNGIILPGDRESPRIVVSDLEFTVNDGRLDFFAGVGNTNSESPDPHNGIWRGSVQQDGTVAWVQLAVGLPPITDTQRISLASDHASTIYAAFSLSIPIPGTTERRPGSNVFKSTDNGATWIATNPPGNFVGTAGNYNLAIGLSPSGRVYLGGQEPALGNGSFLLESNVGATDWRLINKGTNGLQPHADAHVFAFGPDGTVYLGNDGGIYRYDPLPLDAGQSVAVQRKPVGAVAVGDLNKDGNLDMAVVTAGGADILFGRGDGTFDRGPALVGGAGPEAIAVGDFDKDGQLDLVVANGQGASVSLFLRNADGTFKNVQNFAVGHSLGSIVVGDFNGDGRLDVAMRHLDDESFSVLLGDAQATFRLIGSFVIGARTGRLGQLAVGDFNRDGSLDIAATDWVNRRVAVFLGNSKADPNNLDQTMFLPRILVPVNIAASTLAVGDFNGDGFLDVAVGSFRATGTSAVSILLGNPNRGTLFLAPAPVPNVNAARSLAVGDFNGDGKPDLAVQVDGTTARVINGKGDGTFAGFTDYSFGQNANAGSLVVGDFNGDGRPDLAAPDVAVLKVRLALSNSRTSANGRGAWINLNSPGLQTLELYSVDVSPTNRNRLIVTSHDNGAAVSADGGKTWVTVQGVQGSAGGGDGLFAQFGPDGQTVYRLAVGVPTTLKGKSYVGLFRSDDAGQSWKFVGYGLQVSPTLSATGPVAISPADSKTLALGGLKGYVYVSKTGGEGQGPLDGRWDRLTAPRGVTASVSAVTFAKFGSGYGLYMGLSDGTLYKRDRVNPDAPIWKQVNPGSWLPGTSINQIAQDEKSPNTIYVRVHSGAVADNPNAENQSALWRTTDGGQTWESLEFNAGTRVFPNIRVFKIIPDPDFTQGVNARVYVATDVGVMQGTRDANGWTWIRLGNGFPNTIVRDIQLRTYAGGVKVLVAATFGRGAWIMTLSGGTIPSITGLNSGGDKLGGGTEITITGTNFTGATAVLFGSTYASSFRVESDTTIIVQVPPSQIRRTVDVTVVTASGASPMIPADRFSYNTFNPPEVTGLSTVSGPVTGGTLVVISGKQFLGTEHVLFGGVPADFVVNSDTEITAVVPAQSEGTVDVRIIREEDISVVTSADEFTYLPVGAPIVSGIIRNFGPTAGGTVVSILGANLSGVVRVFFGNQEARTFAVNSDAQITATAPAHDQEVVDVRVIRLGPGGVEIESPITSKDEYAYLGRVASTDFTSSDDSSVFGQPITFTATVAAENPGDGTPTGSVIFVDGGTVLDVEVLTNGSAQFTTSSLGLGIHEIVAVYQGDDNFLGSTSALLDQLVLAPTGTVILNALNNSTSAIVSFDDGAGHSGSLNTFLSQFNVTFSGSGVSSLPFATFCIDLFHAVTIGESWAVNFRNDLDAAFANGGARMADLFQQYGSADLTNNPILAAALQLDLWDLSLGGTPTAFTQQVDGSYRSNGGGDVFLSVDLGSNPDTAMIVTLANDLLQQSSGASTRGGWFDSAAAAEGSNRGQSLLMPTNLPVVVGTTPDLTEGHADAVTVARILHTGPSVQAGDLQASINWGDNSALDTNTTIVADGHGGFEVHGTHAYAEEGNYALSVTVTFGTSQVSVAGTALVEDTPLTTQPIAPTFTAAGSALATGQTPDSVATGDLNGDGNADLIVASFTGNSLGAYLGDGAGGFTHLGDYATGNGANGIVVSPDGRTVGVGNYIDGTVSVFATQVDGSLVLTQTLTAAAGTANRMALVDVNDDGIADLVSANQNANSVSVFLGVGDGTVLSGINFAAGNGPIAVVATDFTGDGVIDLMTANYNDSTLSLLPGNGDGTFGAPVVVGSAPGNPFDLISADFNGDGLSDVAVAGLFGQITVFLGNNDGTFASSTYNSGNSPTQLTTGDFNDDGMIDLAVSNYGGNAGVLLGNADGTFQPAISVAASGGLNGVIAGDFDNNGRTDLAVVGQDNNTLQVFFNARLQATESQLFSGVIASFTDGNPNATNDEFSAVIDWGDNTTSDVGSAAFSANGNGGFNLSASHTYNVAGTYFVSVTISDEGGSTTFAEATVYVADLPLSASGTTIAVVEGQAFSGVVASFTDANANTTTDLYSARVVWGDGDVSFVGSEAFTANGSGGFDLSTSHIYVDSGSFTVSITIYDIGGSQATATTTAEIADAPLTAVPPPPLFVPAPGSPISVSGSLLDSVATGDFNGDADLDLLVAGFGSNTVSVVFGDGTGGFTLAATYATGNGANGFAVAPDGSYFAIGNYYDGTVNVFANQGDGTFALSQTLTAASGTANRMALVDVNDDSALDLVTANQNGNNVSIFFGNGDGTFQAGTNFAAGNGPIAVVAADFDGNNTVDLLTANYNDSTLSLLPGLGDGTFGAPVAIASAVGNPFDLVTADFNGDGNVDVAAASLFGQITVVLGNGDGSFQTPVSYHSGANPTQLTAGDFNGDGVIDLAVSNYGNSTVGILLGTGSGTFEPVVSIAASGGLNGIIAGDFNNDGTLDLAVVGQDNATLQVFSNTSLQGTAGQEFVGLLASFTDANPYAGGDEYTAAVDWGDGTTSVVGAEAFAFNAGGGFDLIAGHSYAGVGTYTVHVTITDDGGSFTDAFNTVYVKGS